MKNDDIVNRRNTSGSARFFTSVSAEIYYGLYDQVKLCFIIRLLYSYNPTANWIAYIRRKRSNNKTKYQGKSRAVTVYNNF